MSEYENIAGSLMSISSLDVYRHFTSERGHWNLNSMYCILARH